MPWYDRSVRGSARQAAFADRSPESVQGPAGALVLHVAALGSVDCNLRCFRAPGEDPSRWEIAERGAAPGLGWPSHLGELCGMWSLFCSNPRGRPRTIGADRLAEPIDQFESQLIR